MKKLASLSLVFILCTKTFASNTDSLILLLNSRSNTEKLDILLKISENYRSTNLDSLLKYCNIAIELASDLAATDKQGLALKNKGTILYIKGDVDKAMETYCASQALFEITKNDVEIANIYNNKSTLFLQKGAIPEAINAAKMAIKIYGETGNNALKSSPLINLGRIYYQTGDYNLAELSFTEAAEGALKTNNIKRAIEANSNLAAVYIERGAYANAVSAYFKTIEMCKLDNDQRTLSAVYFNLGVFYYEIGNTTFAIDYINKALSIKKELNLDNNIPLILNQLGIIYCENEKYELALNYFTDALSMAKTFDNKLEVGTALCGMGLVFSETDIYTKALDYYNEALKTFESINSKKEIAETNHKIGIIYSEKLQDITKGTEFYNIALRIFEQINHHIGLATIYTSMAKILYSEAQYNKATTYINKSIKLTSNNNLALLNNYQILADCYSKQKLYKEASECYKLALIYKDSVNIGLSYLQTAKHQVEYQTQKKDQEFANLIRQNELNTLLLDKKRNMQYLFITIIILLSILIGLGVFFYKKLKTINASLIAKQDEIELQKKVLEDKNNQLKKANIEANVLSDFKSQFLANISHEIRTPLNAILGYSKLLANNLTKENNTYHINQVLQSTENMMIIINDLLDFSKIEAGKMVLEKIDFNAVKIVTNAISTLKFKAEEKNIQLEIHIDPFIPKTINGDPYRLSQILVNLISNAIKYSNDGQVVTIEARCENHENVCNLIFAITDHGVGISEHKLSSIFDSFTQVHSDTARLYEGTGLGLSIVKRLIELQNGTINVKSQVKKGSVFTFSIDYKISAIDSTIDESKEETVPKTSFKNAHSILLVEDNLINQELARDTILSWNEPFSVDIAENGKDAIIAIQEKDYSVILMDIQMPIMDGHEATQYIRNSLPNPKRNIPIIGMTAHAMSSEKEIALKNGMNEYMTKPFNPEELKQKIIYFAKLKEKE